VKQNTNAGDGSELQIITFLRRLARAHFRT